MTNFPLYDMVQDARVAFVRTTGMDPTEVWLGPRIARNLVLLEAVNAEVSMGDRCTATEIMAMRKQIGDLTGRKFMDLTIRLMVEEGVRVGVSCEDPTPVCPACNGKGYFRIGSGEATCRKCHPWPEKMMRSITLPPS